MLKLTTLALALALPAAAFASEGKPSPAMDAKIRTLLTDQGYEVRKVEMEDGMFEAYAMKDGKKFEFYLNDQLEVVKTKEN